LRDHDSSNGIHITFNFHHLSLIQLGLTQ
jgi:hypothetical protein